ncbi:MAG: zinc transporter ZupT [Chlorobium limicola]|uniref:Zinc transporter ZupT n=1 Tax=Chlorobium limicola (strain DSM 245 / NBRC 103803 / 6330) TaxID=290315 RepID=ZUPT_CHLL2|nr:zinc transporter ZupT [Chlorobium limicola]B3ECE6.1 RecName: Full=Zinc transporter ZupT [Chlorobium limicola DSM 245]ACD90221.1 zinc/iron permease [Chlorobium limicola DSM 245]NTV07925.1 zinc transporter ZupT [Chlorobium limicola]NTV19956.1 zinc transporter ZupT [Chlorobium limicola]
MSNYYAALALTLLAGISTGIGSLLALMVNHTNKKFLTFALGFSAGIMLYVSFVEIMPQSGQTLAEEMPKHAAGWITTAAFFGGMLFIWLIDQLVPNFENPHEMSMIGTMNTAPSEEARLHRMGIFTAAAIAIHNFPEGLAVFFSALSNPDLGVVIAATIALHNIPEGMAVAVPIYFATKSRMKAFSYSFLSGLAEPLGAIIGYALLKPFLSPLVFACVLGGVAGIMVYISLDELLPAAEEYGEHHIAISGLILGMGVMAVSLLMLA